jgi:hypothetical protein
MWKWTIIAIVFYLIVVIVTKIAGKGKTKKYGKPLDFSKHEDKVVVSDGNNGTVDGSGDGDSGELNNDVIGD